MNDRPPPLSDTIRAALRDRTRDAVRTLLAQAMPGGRTAADVAVLVDAAHDLPLADALTDAVGSGGRVFACTDAGDDDGAHARIAYSALASRARAGSLGAIVAGAHSIVRANGMLAVRGAYGAALAAAAHGVPFVAVAPRAQIGGAASGSDRTAGDRPGDLVPLHLVALVVTEYGASRPPYDEALDDLALFASLDALPHRR